MRNRTIALAVGVLLVAPLVASCTRPRNPSTSTRPGGGGPDCGTVVIGEPVGNKLSCFQQYHTFNARRLTTVENVGGKTVTIVYEASNGHDLTLTLTETDASGAVISTNTKRCEGLGAQIIFDRAGRPRPASNCTISPGTGPRTTVPPVTTTTMGHGDHSH